MMTLWSRMRQGIFVTAALLGLLAVNVGLSVTARVSWLPVLQLTIVASMVVIVLWFSMDVRREPPLLKLFACIGFFWVAILFSLTFIDILSR